MQDVGILQLVDNHFVFPKGDMTKPFPNDHTELMRRQWREHPCVSGPGLMSGAVDSEESVGTRYKDRMKRPSEKVTRKSRLWTDRSQEQFPVGNRLSRSKKGLDAGSANKLVHTQLPSLLESAVWGQLSSFAQTTVTWSHFTHSSASGNRVEDD